MTGYTAFADKVELARHAAAKLQRSEGRKYQRQ